MTINVDIYLVKAILSIFIEFKHASQVEKEQMSEKSDPLGGCFNHLATVTQPLGESSERGNKVDHK